MVLVIALARSSFGVTSSKHLESSFNLHASKAHIVFCSILLRYSVVIFCSMLKTRSVSAFEWGNESKHLAKSVKRRNLRVPLIVFSFPTSCIYLHSCRDFSSVESEGNVVDGASM